MKHPFEAYVSKRALMQLSRPAYHYFKDQLTAIRNAQSQGSPERDMAEQIERRLLEVEQMDAQFRHRGAVGSRRGTILGHLRMLHDKGQHAASTVQIADETEMSYRESLTVLTEMQGSGDVKMVVIKDQKRRIHWSLTEVHAPAPSNLDEISKSAENAPEKEVASPVKKPDKIRPVDDKLRRDARRMLGALRRIQKLDEQFDALAQNESMPIIKWGDESDRLQNLAEFTVRQTATQIEIADSLMRELKRLAGHDDVT